MVKSNLENRTKTYIAGDLNTNKNLIVKLYEWNKTIIDNIKHILRGYDNIIQKLSSVGAKIEII